MRAGRWSKPRGSDPRRRAQHGRVGSQPDDKAKFAQPAAVRVTQYGATARGDDRSRITAHELGESSLFPVAEKGLPLLGENRGHGSPDACLELLIHVEKDPTGAVGQDPPHGRLASATISDERQTPTFASRKRGREVVCHSWRIGDSRNLRATTIASMGAS